MTHNQSGLENVSRRIDDIAIDFNKVDTPVILVPTIKFTGTCYLAQVGRVADKGYTIQRGCILVAEFSQRSL